MAHQALLPSALTDEPTEAQRGFRITEQLAGGLAAEVTKGKIAP